MHPGFSADRVIDPVTDEKWTQVSWKKRMDNEKAVAKKAGELMKIVNDKLSKVSK